DLIGVSGDATNGYYLTYYLNVGGTGFYLADPSLTVTTPTGGSDWNNWTITTCQVASGTEMYLWNRATGALYLWTGLAHTPYQSDLTHTQYTIATSAWNTGADRGLQAADLNSDGTADLYTTAPGGSVQPYLVSLSGTSGTATGGTVLSQDGTQTAGFKIWAEPSDSSWRFGMAETDTAGALYDTATGTANSVHPGVWTKLTATYTQSTGALALFVNGTYAGGGVHAGTWNATGAFQVGDSLNGGTRGGYLAGQVSTVQTWPLALDLGAPPPVTSSTAVTK